MGPLLYKKGRKPVNILTVPTFELKAFLTLSKGKPTNTAARPLYSPCDRCLLVDISGNRVQLTHTNQIWFVRRTAYSFDVSRAVDGYYVLDLAAIAALNLSLRDKVTPLDLDALRATFVNDTYLQGIDFSSLCEKHRQGKHADGSTFDLGYLQAVTRYFKDAKCPQINVTYPQEAYSPLQWDYKRKGSYSGLLMPIRR